MTPQTKLRGAVIDWPKAYDLRDEIYGSPLGAAGCCLHIALDDGNLATDHIQFCKQTAIERNHPKCLEMANLMLTMSLTQRNKLRGRRKIVLALPS